MLDGNVAEHINSLVPQILGIARVENHKEKGGHEIWAKSGLGRSIVLQSHVDPVPEFIIRSNLRTMGLTVKEFISFVERKS